MYLLQITFWYDTVVRLMLWLLLNPKLIQMSSSHWLRNNLHFQYLWLNDLAVNRFDIDAFLRVQSINIRLNQETQNWTIDRRIFNFLGFPIFQDKLFKLFSCSFEAGIKFLITQLVQLESLLWVMCRIWKDKTVTIPQNFWKLYKDDVQFKQKIVRQNILENKNWEILLTFSNYR